MDPSEALALSGVISYVDYRDIPEKGTNIRGLMKDEKVFIDNEVFEEKLEENEELYVYL